MSANQSVSKFGKVMYKNSVVSHNLLQKAVDIVECDMGEIFVLLIILWMICLLISFIRDSIFNYSFSSCLVTGFCPGVL